MKLSRRQFSKSLLAGTLVSGLTGLSYLFAQSAKPAQANGLSGPRGPSDLLAQSERQKHDATLVGIEHGPIVSNSGSHLNPHSHAIEDYKRLPSSDTPASALQGLTVQHLNTRTLISKRTVIDEPLLCPSDRISGVTYLGDGTLLVVINPDAGSAKGDEPSRLLLLNHKKSSNRWEISGPVYVSNLFKDQSLDSLCLLRSGILIGMVTKKDGTGPAHVVEVNPGTGAVSFSNLVSLPADRRFSALAEASDGKLFTSVFRNNGTTELWTLDMTDRTATFLIGLTTLSGCSSKTCTNVPEITPWYHGLQSLIVTPSGQLLAHGNLEYFLPDTLYAINLGTGFMTEIDSYPVARVSLSKQAG
jgi:hypothetical protein